MKLKIFNWLCLGIISLPIFSCKKYNNTGNDLAGNNYIAGTVYLYNDYSENGLLTLLPSQTIKITSADMVSFPNFIYSVNSDSSGGFIFSNLSKDTSYTIFAQDSVSAVEFLGTAQEKLASEQTPINNAKLVLYADSTSQNGFVYTVTDNSGNIISGASVWIFSSPQLASISDSADTCLGCIFNLTTNTFGKASQFNMAPGNYIAVANAAFGPDTLKGIDPTLTISATSFVRHTLKVSGN